MALARSGLAAPVMGVLTAPKLRVLIRMTEAPSASSGLACVTVKNADLRLASITRSKSASVVSHNPGAFEAPAAPAAPARRPARVRPAGPGVRVYGGRSATSGVPALLLRPA